MVKPHYWCQGPVAPAALASLRCSAQRFRASGTRDANKLFIRRVHPGCVGDACSIFSSDHPADQSSYNIWTPISWRIFDGTSQLGLGRTSHSITAPYNMNLYKGSFFIRMPWVPPRSKGSFKFRLSKLSLILTLHSVHDQRTNQ